MMHPPYIYYLPEDCRNPMKQVGRTFPAKPRIDAPSVTQTTPLEMKNTLSERGNASYGGNAIPLTRSELIHAERM
jgi:hypothetical protein